MIGNQKTITVALVSGYAKILLGLFALSPLLAIAYLNFYQDPALVFMHHGFHMVAITLAIAIGIFVSYVTWLCYLDSGEVFLRWLTLGFIGFVVVYLPHGMFTAAAEDNPWLFLLYGPASRVVMAICFLMAMMRFDIPAVKPVQRTRTSPWLIAIGLFLLIDLLVAIWAFSSFRATPWLRISMESTAIGLYIISITWMIIRKIRNPLMVMYAVALAWFAQSSLSFVFGSPWNHQWWLAHMIFASGFLFLSFGVVQAFLSTRSFKQVYNQAVLLEQLREEKNRTEQALVDLRRANDQLEKLAGTDPLTGIANRREFLRRMEQEMARSIRNNASICLLLLDLDHFKSINDKHSHQTGDIVLLEFTRTIKRLLRPADIFGRVGGEEFTILLTDTDLSGAKVTAERIRQKIADHPMKSGDIEIDITVSIGVVEYQPQKQTVSDLMHMADVLLYRAKESGRNVVVSE